MIDPTIKKVLKVVAITATCGCATGALVWGYGYAGPASLLGTLFSFTMIGALVGYAAATVAAGVNYYFDK